MDRPYVQNRDSSELSPFMAGTDMFEILSSEQLISKSKMEASLRMHSHETLRKASRLVLEKGAMCRAISLVGDPREAISNKVAEIKPDMLVVGSHGRGFFGRAFLGSVSEALLRVCECPVVIAKMTKEQHAEANK